MSNTVVQRNWTFAAAGLQHIMHQWETISLEVSKMAHLKGFAKILWPMVTKLVSWLDMNQASEETLQEKG